MVRLTHLVKSIPVKSIQGHSGSGRQSASIVSPPRCLGSVLYTHFQPPWQGVCPCDPVLPGRSRAEQKWRVPDPTGEFPPVPPSRWQHWRPWGPCGLCLEAAGSVTTWIPEWPCGTEAPLPCGTCPPLQVAVTTSELATTALPVPAAQPPRKHQLWSVNWGWSQHPRLLSVLPGVA